MTIEERDTRWYRALEALEEEQRAAALQALGDPDGRWYIALKAMADLTAQVARLEARLVVVGRKRKRKRRR